MPSSSPPAATASRSGNVPAVNFADGTGDFTIVGIPTNDRKVLAPVCIVVAIHRVWRVMVFNFFALIGTVESIASGEVFGKEFGMESDLGLNPLPESFGTVDDFLIFLLTNRQANSKGRF
jgi:hypothetical protein